MILDMEEKIGQVVLNLKFYNGTDGYSDGEIEDTMLKMVMTKSEDDIRRSLGKERLTWPVFYHFSQDRENILNWYPFKTGSKILEIGAGCGAITGCLCRMADQVVAVELSKKRTLINAYRHRNCKNLEIYVGNFYDMVKEMEIGFDYITLIGVFEYAKSYMPKSNPFDVFLQVIRKLLKPHGKVLIAIENRLGMKYFAGCPEDHTGGLYDGIKGYRKIDGVRTFSHSEWEILLKKNGFTQYYFYYPYPDYKIPLVIYSENYLPRRGEMIFNDFNFDRDRFSMFDEAMAWDALSGTKDFEIFSNSFLIEVDNG